jgi:hypothetical protein
MKIIMNNVLVKSDPNDEILLSNGFKLFLDNRFEEQKNAPQSGVVVQLPEKLVFSHDPDTDSLQFNVENELQVGDVIIFNYLAHHFAVSTGAVIDGNILVKYDSIYLAIRNGEVIALNGSVIVEPMNELIKSNIYIPDSYNKRLKNYGRVVYSGIPDKGHRMRTDGPPDMPMLATEEGFSQSDRYAQKGDKVYFHFANAIPLQHNYEMHGKVSKKILYRMKHSDIELIDKTENIVLHEVE